MPVPFCIPLALLTLIGVVVPAWSDDQPVPLLVYTRHHPFLPAASVPMMRVYADGRVQLHRPPGHTRPGNYEIRLSPQQLDHWLALARQAESFDGQKLPVPDIASFRTSSGVERVEFNSDPTVTELYFPVAANAKQQRPQAAAESALPRGRLKVSSFTDLARTRPGNASASLMALERAMLEVFAAAGQ